jgi:hypothetical protein
MVWVGHVAPIGNMCTYFLFRKPEGKGQIERLTRRWEYLSELVFGVRIRFIWFRI